MADNWATGNAAAWLVDRHCDEGRSDRTAIRCGGAGLSYGAVLGEVTRAQHALADLGVAAGDRVAMVVDDEPAFVAWFVGAMRSGAIAVPLSTMLTSAELAPIVADSGARCLVMSAGYADRAADIARHAPVVETIVVLDEAPDGAALSPSVPPDLATDVATASSARVRCWSEFDERASFAPAALGADAPAFWLYSSGTTGTPKGVMHVHGSLRATAETYAHHVLRISADDRCYSVAKLFFAYGLGNSLTFPFAVGATSVLSPERPTPPAVSSLVAQERPTLFFASPGFVAGLLDIGAPPEAFASVRATVTAGEALPADLQRRFSSRMGHPVLDGIGSTEALHIFISNTLDEQHPGTSGRPVPGYDVELRDDEGAVIDAVDTPGYLHVRGPSTATGYWQRPEATAATFVDGWVRTGDVYARSAADTWTFLGRNSDMIKAGGIWVSPAEVESALIEHPDVLEAAVVGARSADGLETTVAFVVPATGATPDLERLQAHCRDRMAAFKRPRAIHLVDELPKTATGKVRRFELRARLDADADTDTGT